MTLEKQLGRFTIAKDKLKGLYDDYVLEGDDLEKAENDAVESLYSLDNQDSRKMFEDDLKSIFEENGRGERFSELKKKHKK